MNNSVKIAFRNMFRQKRRSLMLGSAIAFGMFIITMINGLTSGMVENVKQNVSHLLGGHLFVTGSEISNTGRTVGIIRDDTVVTETMAEMGLKPRYITRRSSVLATFLSGSRSLSQQVEGLDWGRESYIQESLRLESGSLDQMSRRDSIIIPASTATSLKVQVGETLLAKLTTVTGQQNVGEFTVIAIMAEETTFGFASAYAHLDYINSLLNIPAGEYQTLSIYLDQVEIMDQTAEDFRQKLSTRAEVVQKKTSETNATQTGGHGGMMAQDRDMMPGGMGFGQGRKAPVEKWEGTRYRIITLNDILEPFMQIIATLNSISWIVFIILLVITMVGILNTFRMILMERTREIGTIRALGMQKRGVRNTFLLEALFISLMGIAAGVVLSGLISVLLSAWKLPSVAMVAMFLKQGHIRFAFAPWSIVFNAVTVALLSLAAAYLPARKAAELDPAHALRMYY